jgi:hypothetical protein
MEMNYQALAKAERGHLEAVRAIVGSTLRGVEQRLLECFCLKIGIKDLVQAAWIFFTRNTSGKFSGLKTIGCRRHRFRLKIQS